MIEKELKEHPERDRVKTVTMTAEELYEKIMKNGGSSNIKGGISAPKRAVDEKNRKKKQQGGLKMNRISINFNLLTATREEVFERMVNFYKELLLLENQLIKEKTTSSEMKDRYKKLKLTIREEYRIYETVSFRKKMMNLPVEEYKYKNDYVAGIIDACANGLNDNINGNLHAPNLYNTRNELIEYLYHFSDFASMYKEMYDNIEGGKEE